MLARGVAAAPTLMLVDEPTAQLDRATAAEVNDAIGELAATGTTVVVATHDDATRAACEDVLDLGRFR
jgi:lipoprotein-releasing system ATP-binding protein